MPGLWDAAATREPGAGAAAHPRGRRVDRMTTGMNGLGWALVVLGVVLIVVGLVIVAGPRIPILGHLPGDIVIQRENVTIFIPLGTMLLVSVVVSVVIAFLNRR